MGNFLDTFLILLVFLHHGVHRTWRQANEIELTATHSALHQRLGTGTFYEGVLTKGYSTDAADDAVQANIVAAGFGKQ